jgi:nucleotide-binding universal stress UspA family protein
MVDIAAPADLVVFLEPARERDSRLRYAAFLAKQWRAHLIATFVVRELALEPYAGFAVGAALTDMLAEHSKAAAESLSRVREDFDALVHNRSFSSEWRVSDNEDSEALMQHARHASLAVLGPPACQQSRTTRLGLSERLIFESGRPCLLLPEHWPEDRTARRIVVGWNGGREAARSIADAMLFLALAESVHLIVVPEGRSRGAYGPEPGADMAAHLARHGVRVMLERHTGDDAGAVLLERCRDLDADMLVAGGRAHPHISDLLLGGATRTIFEGVKVPLMMSR